MTYVANSVYILIDNVILNLFCEELSKKMPDVEISEIFCFEKNISENRKIHLASLLLGNKQNKGNFSAKKARKLIPYLRVLNEIFEDYLEFSYNNTCLISITRVWQQYPTTILWYVG